MWIQSKRRNLIKKAPNVAGAELLSGWGVFPFASKGFLEGLLYGLYIRFCKGSVDLGPYDSGFKVYG